MEPPAVTEPPAIESPIDEGLRAVSPGPGHFFAFSYAFFCAAEMYAKISAVFIFDAESTTESLVIEDF